MIGRLFVALIFIAVLAVGGLYLYREQQPPAPGEAPVAGAGPPAMPPIPVGVAKVAERDIPDVLALIGTLEAKESLIVKPEIPGQIVGIPFQEGQRVRKGDLLFALDDTDRRAQLREAAVDLEWQEHEHERRKKLHDAKIVSIQELDRARVARDRAQAKVDLVSARLKKTKIFAPFDGIVGLREVSPGDIVGEGQPLVNLEAIDPMRIDFRVPERYWPKVAVGLRVKVKVAAFGERSFEGKVVFFDPRLDEQSRSIRVRAEVPNAGRVLRPGMFANVKLHLGVRKAALLVPEEALLPVERRVIVYRVVEDRAEAVVVETGARTGREVEIVKGLSRGDRVIVSGLQKIRPGAKVMPMGSDGSSGPAKASEKKAREAL